MWDFRGSKKRVLLTGGVVIALGLMLVGVIVSKTGNSSDWKTYKNETFGFSFQYPTHLQYHAPSCGGVQADTCLASFSAEPNCVEGQCVIRTGDDSLQVSVYPYPAEKLMSKDLRYETLTAGEQKIFLSAVLQGYESGVREALIPLGDRTIALSAEGQIPYSFKAILRTFKVDGSIKPPVMEQGRVRLILHETPFHDFDYLLVHIKKAEIEIPFSDKTLSLRSQPVRFNVAMPTRISSDRKEASVIRLADAVIPASRFSTLRIVFGDQNFAMRNGKKIILEQPVEQEVKLESVKEFVVNDGRCLDIHLRIETDGGLVFKPAVKLISKENITCDIIQTPEEVWLHMTAALSEGKLTEAFNLLTEDSRQQYSKVFGSIPIDEVRRFGREASATAFIKQYEKEHRSVLTLLDEEGGRIIGSDVDFNFYDGRWRIDAF